MPDIKKSIVVLLMVLSALGFGVWGCGPGAGSSGGGDAAAASGPALSESLGLGLEDVSATGVESLLSEGMDAAPAAPETAVSDPAVLVPPPPPPPPAPGWWPLLHPLRFRARDEARAVIEAPAHLFYYVVTHRADLPDCVSVSASGVCPLDHSDPAGSCTTQVTFTGPCRLTFTGDGRPDALDLSGELTHAAAVVEAGSAPAALDGKWNEVLTATAFVVSDPASLRSMTYDGTVSRASDGTAAAAPYTFRHVWESDGANDPMTLVDGRGDELIVDGTREVRVIPGDSVEELIDSYPTLIPALDPRPRHFHRTVHRAWVRDGDTVGLTVNAVTVNLDRSRTWTRAGDYTLHRENPTKVVVNGRGALTFPDGRVVTTELIDVKRDLNQQVPISGAAITTFDDGLVYTVTFSGVCLIHWEDNRGGSGQVNLCQWKPFDQ